MNAKRILVLLLVFVMVFSVAACGKKEEPQSEETKTEGTEKEEPAKVYNVANLVNGNLGDKSFFDSAEAGLRELESQGRITVKTIEMGATDADKPKWEETLNEVSSSGEYDVIICGTYQMPEYVAKAAAAYPDQKYIIYDSSVEAPNVCNINYKQNDLGYLVGTLAGALTKAEGVQGINPEPVVGFVGGVDAPVINDFLYGFLLGAQNVNPDVKVDTRYVSNFYDTAAAKEMALSMINDKKCDLVWGVAGLAGNGAAEAAKESGKAWFIGVDSDQELTLPTELAGNTITSGLKNVGTSLIWFFDELDAGKEHYGELVLLGIQEGGVGIVTDKNYAKNVPDEIKALVEQAQKDVVDGKVVVPTAIGEEKAAGEDKTGVEKLRDSLQP